MNRRRQKSRQKARRLDQQRAREANRREREEQRQAYHQRIEEGEQRGCLFCRRSDGGFTSVEHTLPESLGNTEVVLPNGVVCDRCNHGVLSDLDGVLTNFLPVTFRRTSLGIPSKSGRVPVTRFSKGRITNRGRDPQTLEPQLFFEIHSEKDTETFKVTELGDGRVHIHFTLSGGKPITPRYAWELSRAILKAAFESAWLDLGENMLRPEFDHVREAVLGAPRDGYLAVPRQADPDHTGMELIHWPVPPEQGGPFFAAMLKLYGIVLGTDSLNPVPRGSLPEEHVIVQTFTKGDAPQSRKAS